MKVHGAKHEVQRGRALHDADATADDFETVGGEDDDEDDDAITDEDGDDALAELALSA